MLMKCASQPYWSAPADKGLVFFSLCAASRCPPRARRTRYQVNRTAKVPVKAPDASRASRESLRMKLHAPSPALLAGEGWGGGLRVLLVEIVAGAGLGLLATLVLVATSRESAVRSQQTGLAFAIYCFITIMTIGFGAVAVPVVCFMAQVFWQMFNPKK